MQQFAGQLFALITAGCWAHNSVVYSLAGRRIGSGAVTHIRLWIAFPVIVCVHLIARGAPIPLSLEPGSWCFLSISGFLGFFLADVLIFAAFVELGHRETLVILVLSPLFASLISRLVFGELLDALQVSGIVVIVAGIVLVVVSENRGPDGRRGARGLVLATLGAVAQALGMVLAKRGLEIGEVHPISANIVRIGAGLIGLVCFRVVTKRFVDDFRSMRDRRTLVLVAQGAIVGPVLGIIMNLYALTLAPVGVVTAIMQTSPIMLLPYDRFVLKKHIPLGAFLGTVVAVTGAVLLFL